MPKIKYKPEEVSILARLMRAEAENQGEKGLMSAGNTMVNRVVAGSDPKADEYCRDFKGINTIQKMAFQKPGGFVAVDHSYFYQEARPEEKQLAQRLLDGEKVWPGKYALWFMQPSTKEPEGSPKYCPKDWYKQPLADGYKSHCFYQPSEGVCPAVYK